MFNRSHPLWTNKSVVYFAHIVSIGQIKIGYTNNLRSRAPEIHRNGIRNKADIIAIVPGKTGDEARFHAYFEPLHIDSEWFLDAPELLTTIDELNAGAFDFGKLPNPGWCITKPKQSKASILHWGRLPRYEGASA